MKKALKKPLKSRRTDERIRHAAEPCVKIEFVHPTAETVCIAGTFNDWHPRATEMVALGEGRWAKELVLPPGVHEYRIVVDGEWMADPSATETAPNPYGGLNSVLRVPAP